jgi:hypothetical protein
MKKAKTNSPITEVDDALLKKAKVGKNTLLARLNAGWPAEEAARLPASTVLVKNKPCKVDDLARELGVTKRHLVKTIGNDMHADHAIEVVTAEQARTKQKVLRPRKAILYKGKTWTIAELARHTGIKYITLSMRLRKGWPVEKAIEAPLREWPKYDFKGRQMTIAEIANETGVSRGLLSARVARGMSVEDALRDDISDVSTKGTRMVRDTDGNWITVMELSKRTGVPYVLLTRRLFRDKMTVEQAISMPEHKRKVYTVKGKRVTVLDVTKMINRCTGTVYLHLREGMTMDEIVDKYLG